MGYTVGSPRPKCLRYYEEWALISSMWVTSIYVLFRSTEKYLYWSYNVSSERCTLLLDRDVNIFSGLNLTWCFCWWNTTFLFRILPIELQFLISLWLPYFYKILSGFRWRHEVQVNQLSETDTVWIIRVAITDPVAAVCAIGFVTTKSSRKKKKNCAVFLTSFTLIYRALQVLKLSDSVVMDIYN
jgi:hypothetical protein